MFPEKKKQKKNRNPPQPLECCRCCAAPAISLACSDKITPRRHARWRRSVPKTHIPTKEGGPAAGMERVLRVRKGAKRNNTSSRFSLVYIYMIRILLVSRAPAPLSDHGRLDTATYHTTSSLFNTAPGGNNTGTIAATGINPARHHGKQHNQRNGCAVEARV